jgi:hypothetical protein
MSSQPIKLLVRYYIIVNFNEFLRYSSEDWKIITNKYNEKHHRIRQRKSD